MIPFLPLLEIEINHTYKKKEEFFKRAQRIHTGRVYDSAKINGQYPINLFVDGCLYLKLLSATDLFSFQLRQLLTECRAWNMGHGIQY